MHCVLVTCAELPDLDPDDRVLAAALSRLGTTVSAAVWNDPAYDWGCADVTVVRSTWDYHKQPRAFEEWADATASQTLLLNPAPVMRWNTHKSYLRELAERGIPIVPTVWLQQGAPADVTAIMEPLGWSRAVIKPAHGASADMVMLVDLDRECRDEAQDHLNGVLARQDVLVQSYVSTIDAYPERALVFIDGAYSHAVYKLPFMHANLDLAHRLSQPPGASGEVPVIATGDEIRAAYDALEASPAGHVYARVDLVRYEGTICVLEVELIEPTLYFYARPDAADSLANAIHARVRSSR